MNATEQIEISKKSLPNGQVVVVYKKNGRVFRDIYASQSDAASQDPKKVISRSYQRKEDQNRTTLVFIDPLNPSHVLKTLKYSEQNVLLEEVHFNENNQKKLVRTYKKGILDQAWTFDPETDKIKSGVQYKKNDQGGYEIISVSKPIFDAKGELSHTVQQEATPDGKPTGFITQRVFYLCNLPFVKANYTRDKENPKKILLTISSLEDGVWQPVTDPTLRNHLKSIFQDVITLESEQLQTHTLTPVQEPDKQQSSSVLGKNANIEFTELYYDEVESFKQENPSLKIFPLSKIKQIPTAEQRQEQLSLLTPQELEFVQKANNAGLFVSFTPKNANSNYLFAPTRAQYKNAENSRARNEKNAERLPYADLLNAKEEFENIAIISETESDILPYIPTLRKECFNSLSNEAQCFILRANLAGLNVTANGQNGLPFLYMAPTTEIQREHMRSQLEKLEQTMAETLSHGGNTHYSSQAEQNHTAHNSIQKY